MFRAKWIDFLNGVIWSHEVAKLQMFVAWIRVAVWRSQKWLMQSFLVFLQCQVRPSGVACPLCGGGVLLAEWGCTGPHTPLAVLESLVVLQVVAAEPWCALVPGVHTLCLSWVWAGVMVR